MTAYMFFLRETPVSDPEEMAVYQAKNCDNAEALLRYGPKPLVVYGATEAVEGEAPDGTILFEFPTAADARAFYDSPEYQDALPHRLRAARYRAFIVEGI